MSSTRENVCCRESELVLPNLDSYDCITDHPNFETIALNPMVLEVSFIQIRSPKIHALKLGKPFIMHLNKLFCKFRNFREGLFSRKLSRNCDITSIY